MEYNQSEFLIETIVPQDELIISRTDLKGIITYANETFAQISGYSVDELIGKPHNCVRHPDMPKRAYKDMWNKLQNQQQWKGVVKNLRKDTGYYWVHATISGVYKDDKLVEYKSIRVPISYDEKLKYQKLYDNYRNIDKENIRRVIYS
ncbi:PAS domain-containing protein [Poseidonibacter sp.]|jgi:aerotaxis receptor|uniref:PAS domain-containing protein n=1 Tax=Poseidonibacter sp. TaxID=2321188 RepID=UPI003C72F349